VTFGGCAEGALTRISPLYQGICQAHASAAHRTLSHSQQEATRGVALCYLSLCKTPAKALQALQPTVAVSPAEASWPQSAVDVQATLPSARPGLDLILARYCAVCAAAGVSHRPYLWCPLTQSKGVKNCQAQQEKENWPSGLGWRVSAWATTKVASPSTRSTRVSESAVWTSTCCRR
jgi:hypothetical protein